MTSRRFSVVSLQKKECIEETKSSNVKVVVRVRPPNEKELSCGKTNVIKVVDDFMLTFDPKEDDINNFSSSKPRMSILDKRLRDLHFAFDRVFDDTTSNAQVFEHTTKGILDSILDGYNCSVFAYGATSAGKTHTMLGSQKEPGVIFLTMMELYVKLMAKDDEYDTDISVSYLEIYNENCKDLLLPTGPLAVREDPDKGVCVNGLSLHKPRSAEELLEMLHFGNQNRSQHPTDANKQSSRSHAVFQVFVRQCPKDSVLTASVKVAKISLIDLAGSERATVTTNRGDRLREGANINKSLLALGNCINALAENKNNLHIPYRNSKLTRLLKDSLGGNCKTIMIAAVSPSTLSYEDTYNTLKYANRAKNIKSSLSANTLNVDYHVTQYAKIVEDLKKQIEILQIKIDKFENGSISPQRKEDDRRRQVETVKRYEQDLQSLYKEKTLFKQQLIDCEATEKELMIKFMHKERSFQLYTNLKMLISKDDEAVTSEEAMKGLEKSRTSNALKLSKVRERGAMLKSSMEENKSRLVSLQNEIDQWANKADSIIRAQINMMYDLQQLSVENISLKTTQRYIKKYLQLQEVDAKKNERVTSNLIQIVQAQQRKIEYLEKGHTHQDILDISKQLQDLPKCLMNTTQISWADQSLLESSKMTNLGNFASCTPFKTPSRKPDVLRQLIIDSRHRHSDQTGRNTAVNTGPVRSKLMFTDKENAPKESSTDSGYLPDIPNQDQCSMDSPSMSKEIRRETYLVESPAKLNETISLSHQDNLSVMEIQTALTSPPPHETNKSYIPVRTPLKSFNENLPITRNGGSRMRSFTEGNGAFVVGNETLNIKKEQHMFDNTFTVRSMSSYVKGTASQLKRKKLKLGPPSRAVSSNDLRKENIRPRSSINHQSNYRSRCMKTAQSLASLSKKSINSERSKFRF